MHQSQNIKHYAIIVAGGSGSRMQSAVPKQFLLLNGEPIVMHTIKAFNNSTYSPAIILVLHPDYHYHWNELCSTHSFTIPHTLISGGETRFHSVKNALDTIDQEALIAINDAVRPLVSTQVIDNAYQQAAKQGNAVVAVKSRDSVRQVRGNNSVSLLRDEIYMVQTPQTFQSAQLKKAYQQTYQTSFTDDASVVELAGYPITIVEGDTRNIKITFPEDITFAELLLKQKQPTA